MGAQAGAGIGGGAGIKLNFYLDETATIPPRIIGERNGITVYKEVDDEYAMFSTPDGKVHVDFDHAIENSLGAAQEENTTPALHSRK